MGKQKNHRQGGEGGGGGGGAVGVGGRGFRETKKKPGYVTARNAGWCLVHSHHSLASPIYNVTPLQSSG